MPFRVRVALPLLLAMLAGCQASPGPGPRVPAATRLSTTNELMPSGKPYDGPPGPVSSFPPADNNGQRLRCHPEGIGTRCDRADPAGS